MGISKFKKQAYESFPTYGNFENVLMTGETIVVGSSAALCVDADGNDVSTTVLDPSSLQVQGGKLVVRCRDGSESASPYIITFRIYTTDNNKYETDLQMTIKEI